MFERRLSVYSAGRPVCVLLGRKLSKIDFLVTVSFINCLDIPRKFSTHFTVKCTNSKESILSLLVYVNAILVGSNIVFDAIATMRVEIAPGVSMS